MIDNPMLNLSYEQPDPYYEIGWQRPAAVSCDGRRPSESLTPIAIIKKSKRSKDGSEQVESDFEAMGEVLFCQREAAGTAIFLTEPAGHGYGHPIHQPVPCCEADPTRLSPVPLPADQSVCRSL